MAIQWYIISRDGFRKKLVKEFPGGKRDWGKKTSYYEKWVKVLSDLISHEVVGKKIIKIFPRKSNEGWLPRRDRRIWGTSYQRVFKRQPNDIYHLSKSGKFQTHPGEKEGGKGYMNLNGFLNGFLNGYPMIYRLELNKSSVLS